MLRRSMGLVALVLVTTVGLAACADAGGQNVGATAPGSSGGLEPSTPRGLAAGLLAHLTSVDVTSVGGSEEGGAQSVMIGTSNPSLAVVHLYVQNPGTESSVRQCGLDSGYARVACQTEPHLLEIVTRNNGDSGMPVLMGRYYDDTRGSVLVQLWGSDSPATRQLIREVLSDSLLGAHTSAALVAKGEQLPDFEEERSETTLTTK